MRTYKELKDVLKSYGEALIVLPEYKRRFDENPRSHWVYVAYSEQLNFVHNLKKNVEDMARELAAEKPVGPTLEGRLNQPFTSEGEAIEQMKANGDVLTPLAEKILKKYERTKRKSSKRIRARVK